MTIHSSDDKPMTVAQLRDQLSMLDQNAPVRLVIMEPLEPTQPFQQCVCLAVGSTADERLQNVIMYGTLDLTGLPSQNRTS